MSHAGLAATNLLDVVPVRVAQWDEQADRVVVRRPRPHAPWYLLPLEWIRFGLAVPRIRLDAVGSAAWRACDGRNTVADIALRIRAEFGGPAEPVEERLGHLVRRLWREGLITYGHPSPPSGSAAPGVGPVERLLN